MHAGMQVMRQLLLYFSSVACARVVVLLEFGSQNSGERSVQGYRGPGYVCG